MTITDLPIVKVSIRCVPCAKYQKRETRYVRPTTIMKTTRSQELHCWHCGHVKRYRLRPRADKGSPTSALPPSHCLHIRLGDFFSRYIMGSQKHLKKQQSGGKQRIVDRDDRHD